MLIGREVFLAEATFEVDEFFEVGEEGFGVGFGEVGGFEFGGEGVGGEDVFAEADGGFLVAFGVVAFGPDLEEASFRSFRSWPASSLESLPSDLKVPSRVVMLVSRPLSLVSSSSVIWPLVMPCSMRRCWLASRRRYLHRGWRRRRGRRAALLRAPAAPARSCARPPASAAQESPTAVPTPSIATASNADIFIGHLSCCASSI